MYTIKYVDTVNVNIPLKYLFCVPRAARGEDYISYLINIDFMDIDIFLKKSHEKIYDMQLKHWQMSISHFHHELDIFLHVFAFILFWNQNKLSYWNIANSETKVAKDALVIGATCRPNLNSTVLPSEKRSVTTVFFLHRFSIYIY